jgi:hypothetical protein
MANVNHSAWKWTNNPDKSDETDAHRLAMMYHQGFFPDVYIPEKAVRQKRRLIYYRQKIANRMTQVKNGTSSGTSSDIIGKIANRMTQVKNGTSSGTSSDIIGVKYLNSGPERCIALSNEVARFRLHYNNLTYLTFPI